MRSLTCHPDAPPQAAQDDVPRGRVREGAVDALVEPAGAQEGRVDEVGPRGGRQDVYPLGQRLEPVECREQLVDDAVWHAGAVVPAARREAVELVEEQEARWRCSRSEKKIMDGVMEGVKKDRDV